MSTYHEFYCIFSIGIVSLKCVVKALIGAFKQENGLLRDEIIAKIHLKL